MGNGPNKGWLRNWLSGKPHCIIGGDDPYLLRWYVIPRNRFFNIYLHKFLRSDDDRALHDHPWWFMSLILKGAYFEHREDGWRIYRDTGTAVIRCPNTLHRVELQLDEESLRDYMRAVLHNRPIPRLQEKPVWTLFLTGPKLRDWGFACPKGWVHWETFVHNNGCGEN